VGVVDVVGSHGSAARGNTGVEALAQAFLLAVVAFFQPTAAEAEDEQTNGYDNDHDNPLLGSLSVVIAQK
jgi:hypothetical protein